MDRELVKRWKYEVQTGTDPKWYGNGTDFATEEEAEEGAKGMALRWLLVVGWRVRELTSEEMTMSEKRERVHAAWKRKHAKRLKAARGGTNPHQ